MWGDLVIFAYKNGYYINEEKGTAFKEPALIINTESWTLTNYGEKEEVVKIFEDNKSKYERILVIFDKHLLKPKKIVEYLERFLFNKDFVKFQLLSLYKEANKMLELNRKLANETCCFCDNSVDELVSNDVIVYICPKCEKIICEECLQNEYGDLDMQNAEYTQECPECGDDVKMLEITREDLERVTFDDMFGE